VFWFKALEHGDTFIVSNLLYLTPAISLLFVLLLLDEPVHASAVSGLVLIIAGILFQSRQKLFALTGIGRRFD
jgi:drug/metabolite transporter (DMT)-like permease